MRFSHELKQEDVAGGEGGKSGSVHVCRHSRLSEIPCWLTALLQKPVPVSSSLSVTSTPLAQLVHCDARTGAAA